MTFLAAARSSRVFASAVVLAALFLARPVPVAAQAVLGTYSWQLQPFCNTVVLQVTQEGATYRLAGWEDTCGAVARQPVQGTVAVNGDGSVGFLLVSASTGATPVTTTVRFNPATLGGPWTDSAGNSGTFAFGVAGGGPVRPLGSGGLAPASVTSTTIVDGSINSVDVNSTQVQLRVAGACPAGQAMRAVNADGTVACQPTNVAQVVWVATSGAGFTSVQAAVNSITDASSAKPYVVMVAPGVYDEPGGVTLKNFVRLVGSGREVTTIRCACGAATSTGAGVATVRIEGLVTTEVADLTIVNTGGGAHGAAVLVSGAFASPVRLTRLAAVSSGAGSNGYGVALVDSSSTIEQVRVTVSGAITRGIDVNGTSTPVIDGATVVVSGTTGSLAGIFIAGVGTTAVRNVNVTVSGSNPIAMFMGTDATVENAVLTASGPSVPYGALIFGSTVTMRGVTITSTSTTAGTAYGLRNNFSTAALTVHGSSVTGNPSVDRLSGGTARIANTQLTGATAGAPTCFSVYSATFTTFTCT